jgi:hypothetical protein
MQQSVHLGVAILIVLACTGATVAIVRWAYGRETHKRPSRRLLTLITLWLLMVYAFTVFVVDPAI